MFKMKKWIFPLFIFILAMIVMTVKANNSSRNVNEYIMNSSSTLLDSNLFTHVDDTKIYNQSKVDMTNYTKTLENDHLILYVDDAGFAIRIENRLTGYIWSSEPTSGSLSRTYKERSRSAVLLSYIDGANYENLDVNLFDFKDLSLSKQVDEANKTVTFFVDLVEKQIKFSYTIKLTNDSIEVSLNNDSIVEYGTNKLVKVQFYEFFGATYKNNIPGYNFIPSGNGALVRYTSTSPISAEYKAHFLGEDLYYYNGQESYGLNLPVYGGVHGINQNGYFVNIVEGAEHAVYSYTPTGFRTAFHRQGTSFNIRRKIIIPIKGTTSSITLYEKLNYDIKFNITFLTNEEANYVGMAKLYKNYLVNSGMLIKTDYTSENIKLHLDVLGSDYEEGIFFNKTHKMTTVSDILDINEELIENNVDNIFYTLRGFNTGGNTKASYSNYTFSKSLGNYRRLEELDVAYYYNPVVSFKTKEGAPRHSLETAYKNFATVQIPNGNYFMYYTDINEIADEFGDAYDKIQNYGGMALDGLSNQFYSNKNSTRTQMYDLYDELLTETIPMYNPNLVMLNHTSKYLNIPLQHDRLRFFTDTVPFLQIVLSGYIPYYSTYLNFSANMNIDLLKAIDYGVNPAYLITKQPSHLLSNTISREYYGSYYGNLNEYIIEHYNFINNALKDVMGHEIISRTVVADGVVVTKYDNNIEIIVNYNNTEFNYNGNTVQAMNYFKLGS